MAIAKPSSTNPLLNSISRDECMIASDWSRTYLPLYYRLTLFDRGHKRNIGPLLRGKDGKPFVCRLISMEFLVSNDYLFLPLQNAITYTDRRILQCSDAAWRVTSWWDGTLTTGRRA